MITNHKQYLAAKEKVSMLKSALIQQKKPAVSDVLEVAHDAQVLELLSEIESEIKEYEALKNVRVSVSANRAVTAIRKEARKVAKKKKVTPKQLDEWCKEAREK